MSILGKIEQITEPIIQAVGSAVDAAEEAVTGVADSAAEQVGTLFGEVEQEQAQSDEFVSSSSETSSRASSLDSDITSTSAEIDDNDAQSQELSSQISSTDDEISSNETSLSSVKTDLSNTKAQLSSVNSEIGSIDSDIEASESELDNLQSLQNSAPASSSEDEASESVDYSGQIATVSNQLQTAKNQKAQLESEKEDLEGAESELEDTEDGLETTISGLEDTKSGLETSKSNVDAKGGELKGKKAALEADGYDVEASASELAPKGNSTAQRADSTAKKAYQLANEANDRYGYGSAPYDNYANDYQDDYVGGSKNSGSYPPPTKGGKTSKGGYSAALAQDLATSPNAIGGKPQGRYNDYGESQTPALQKGARGYDDSNRQGFSTNAPQGRSPLGKDFEQFVKGIHIARKMSPEQAAQMVRGKIGKNESIDHAMAEMIFNDMCKGGKGFNLSVDELIGMNAQDGIQYAERNFRTQAFSSPIYSTKISSNTDTASVEENQEAISDFMSSYAEALEKVNSPKVEFLSLTDKSNFDSITTVFERLNEGEYILTKEINKATTTADSIQVATVETEEKEDKTNELKGNELLKELKAEISEDETIKEDLYDDILTKKEYDDLDNFFNDSDNKTDAYKKLVEEAKKYGIFANAA